jgi:hypothetical protein
MRTLTLSALALLVSGCATGGRDMAAAQGFQGLFLHDDCIGENVAQPDTCLHLRRHERSFVFGGEAGTTYDVTVRVRGLFEPTTMTGGAAPDPAHPYFYRGGQTSTGDYSQWRIDVSSPKQTYILNHYPAVSHTIYKEDFEARIAVEAGATVTVRSPAGDRGRRRQAAGGPDATA